MPLSTIFQLYHQFYWWGKPEYLERKPLACHKSLTNFITWSFIEYTSPWAGFELTNLMVIGTDCTGSCKSNYHVITVPKNGSPLDIKLNFVFKTIRLYINQRNVKMIKWYIHDIQKGWYLFIKIVSSCYICE
jgi:hypothetical protein